MLDALRKPLFLVALILIAIAVFLEAVTRIGFGMRGAAILDGLLLFTIFLISLSLLLPESLHGRIQALITLIVGIVAAILSFVLAFASFFALMEMLALIMATPFGTIIYIALFGHFQRDDANKLFGLALLLKLFFAAFLVASEQRFLQNKKLIILIATVLIANVVVTFLHGLVPLALVSITDSIAGIIVGIIALIWAIFFVLDSIPGVFRAVGL